MLVIHDPKALHTVMVKNQELYSKSFGPSKYVAYAVGIPLDALKPRADCSELMVLLGPGLLSTRGMQHKKQRKLLNPVFSSPHLRDMSQTFYKVAHKVRPSAQAL